jgi:hypothetical protein
MFVRADKHVRGRRRDHAGMNSPHTNRRLLLVADRRLTATTDPATPVRRFRLARVASTGGQPAALPARKHA